MRCWRRLAIVWATGAALYGPAIAQDQVAPTSSAPIPGGGAGTTVAPVWPRRAAVSGRNGAMGKDHTLFARTGGKVEYRKGYKRRTYVSVVPDAKN